MVFPEIYGVDRKSASILKIVDIEGWAGVVCELVPQLRGVLAVDPAVLPPHEVMKATIANNCARTTAE
jgi:hypothetical protein